MQPGDRVAVEAQIAGRPPWIGTVLQVEEYAVEVLPDGHIMGLWCEREEVSLAKGK